MNSAQNNSGKGTWMFSFAVALIAHGAVVGYGLASMAPPPVQEKKQTEIAVSTMTLEKPDASIPTLAKSVADAVSPDELAKVEGAALEAAASNLISAVEDSEQVASIDADDLSANTADTAQNAQTNERTKSVEANLAQPNASQTVQRIAATPDRPKAARSSTAAVTTATTSIRARPESAVVTGVELGAKPTPAATETVVASAQSVVSKPSVSGVVVNSAKVTSTALKPSSTVPVSAQSSAVQGTVVVGAPSAAQPVESTGQAGVAVAALAPDSSVTEIETETISKITGQVASGTEVKKLTAQESAALYQDLLKSIGSYEGGECFAALPELGAEGAVSLRSFARTAGELAVFSEALEAEVGIAPPSTLRPISNAQCAALDFASLAPTYPQFRMYLDLDETDIKGTARGNSVEFVLSGLIGNSSGGFRNLLVVDDKGLVQDLSAFMSPGLSRVGFNVTLTFKGDRVQTEQIIMALQTSVELTTIREFSGRPAEQFFQRLNLEAVLTGAEIDLAVASFIVR